jgi:hypothetical protein
MVASIYQTICLDEWPIFMTLKVFYRAALVAMALTARAAHGQPVDQTANSLQAYLEQLELSVPLFPANLASISEASAPAGAVGAAVRDSLAKLRAPIEALRRSPLEDFLVAVDSHGGIYVVDLVANPGAITALKPPVSDTAFDTNNKNANTIESYIRRGGDPPVNAVMAKIAGMSFRPPKTVMEGPAMSWVIATGASRTAAPVDCLFITYHRNFPADDVVKPQSTVDRVCHTNRGFDLKHVVTAKMADPVQSPDGRRIAYVNWDGLFVRDIDGRAIATSPGDLDFGEVIWLDNNWVMSFSDFRPAQVHDLKSGATSELAYQDRPGSQRQSGLRIARAQRDPNNQIVQLFGPNGSAFVWVPGSGDTVGPAQD